MISCYSLLDIVIGAQDSQARPIEWDTQDIDGFGNNVDKQPVQAVGWHTTCPFCAQLIEFRKIDLYLATNGSENNVKCSGCGAGNPIKRAQYITPTIDTLTIRDPLPDWSYTQVPIDLERLTILDAELSKAF